MALKCEDVAIVVVGRLPQDGLQRRLIARSERLAQALGITACWSGRLGLRVEVTRRRIILVRQLAAQVELVPENVVVVIQDGQHGTAQLP